MDFIDVSAEASLSKRPFQDLPFSYDHNDPIIGRLAPMSMESARLWVGYSRECRFNEWNHFERPFVIDETGNPVFAQSGHHLHGRGVDVQVIYTSGQVMTQVTI